MQFVLRRVSVFVFSFLFVWITGFLAHAQVSAIKVQPADSFYPIEKLQENGIRVEREKSAHWIFLKQNQRYRIFSAGNMDHLVNQWDSLDRVMFLQRLENKGARGIASIYKAIPLRDLEAAEAELRKVREEP